MMDILELRSSQQAIDAVNLLKTAILQSQARAANAVNQEQLALYYGVGRFLSLNTRNKNWGAGMIKSISQRLRSEIPGLRGFGETNLMNLDNFPAVSFLSMGIDLIGRRLFPFIERIRSAHPETPIIFLQTIRRENRNFSTAHEKREAERQAGVIDLMKQACKKYKNVHFIGTTNAADPRQETSVDGIHPNDYGYTLWAESIRKPLLKILAKYDIR